MHHDVCIFWIKDMSTCESNIVHTMSVEIEQKWVVNYHDIKSKPNKRETLNTCLGILNNQDFLHLEWAAQ